LARLKKSVESAREDYYYYTGKTSDIVRQLALAGVALIWLFRIDRETGIDVVPSQLRVPAILIVACLAADLLQYVWGSAAWGIYSRIKELQIQRREEDEEFWAPDWINRPTNTLFVVKILLMGWAYVLIGRFLLERVL
jgi:hypothetical protein